MAKYDSVLMGTLSQSVDNVTAYVSRRQRIVRHKATKVHNPRTEKQRKQRAKMKAAVVLASAFAPVAKVGFPAQAAGQTGYNGFVAANLPAVIVDEKFVATVDFTKLVCSVDLKLHAPKVTASVSAGKVVFSQEGQEASAYANRDDRVYGVLFEKTLNEVELVELRERGESGSTSCTLMDEWTSENVVAYAFVTNATGRRTSRTIVVALSGE